MEYALDLVKICRVLLGAWLTILGLVFDVRLVKVGNLTWLAVGTWAFVTAVGLVLVLWRYL